MKEYPRLPGYRHQHARVLTPQQVGVIKRELLKDGSSERVTTLAQEYKVRAATIRAIRDGNNWLTIPPAPEDDDTDDTREGNDAR